MRVDEGVVCPFCGERTAEIWTVQVAPQTHWQPAEYEDDCALCLPMRYRDRDRDREDEDG